MTAIASKIMLRIRAKQRGWVFAPRDFTDLGARAVVDQTLSRLVRKGSIRRLGRGVYDYPRHHAVLGTLAPDADSLAQAVSAKSGDTAFPSGAVAANLLGLSTQVPARPVYLTNGRSRTRKIAGRTITLKHARVPLLSQLPDKVNLTLQALSYIGKDNLDDQALSRCAKKLNDGDMRALVIAASYVPSWMADKLRRIQQLKHG